MTKTKKDDGRCLFMITESIRCKNPKYKEKYCKKHCKLRRFDNTYMYHKYIGKYELFFD